MYQAIIGLGLGGGLETSLASRFRFCTVPVNRNSSFAPDRPRSLSLDIARLRFASPNNFLFFYDDVRIGYRLHCHKETGRNRERPR